MNPPALNEPTPSGEWLTIVLVVAGVTVAALLVVYVVFCILNEAAAYQKRDLPHWLQIHELRLEHKRLKRRVRRLARELRDRTSVRINPNILDKVTVI